MTEDRNLLFEPVEENPMIAWRGAARYIDPRFRPAFDMECEALRFVRQQIGLDNLQVMVPFCRSPEEGKEVVRLLDGFGLSPDAGVPLFLMVELPSNVLEAERFIDLSRDLEMLGPSALGIVCFRFNNPDVGMSPETLEELNTLIQEEIVDSGLAMMSSTRLRDTFSLRLSILNYRSTWGDVKDTLEAVVRIGHRLSEEMMNP